MPLKSCFIEIWPEAISEIIVGIKYGLTFLGLFNSLLCCSSKVLIPPIPDPIITPILFLSVLIFEIFESLIASSAAIIAKAVNLSILLSSFVVK